MFEVLEHTADIGFRVRAASAAELFEQAAAALAALAFKTELVRELECQELSAEALDYESLMVNWLSEVLYLLDARRLLLKRFEVSEISPQRVRGRGWGEYWNAERHRAKLVIKGVTYHQLVVQQQAQGWCAQVILDI